MLVSKGGCKKHQVNYLGVATAQICTWSDFWGAEIVLNSRLATWTISVILATSSMVSVMFLKNIRAFTSSLRTQKNQINVTLNIRKPTLLDLIIYICGPIMDQPSKQTTSQHPNKNIPPLAVFPSIHPSIHPSIVWAKASSWRRHAAVIPSLWVINSRENSYSSWCNGSRCFVLFCFFTGRGREGFLHPWKVGRGKKWEKKNGCCCFFGGGWGKYRSGWVWIWLLILIRDWCVYYIPVHGSGYIMMLPFFLSFLNAQVFNVLLIHDLQVCYGIFRSKTSLKSHC